MAQTSKLALFGGGPAVQGDYKELFTWPIITDEDEAAVLDIIRRGAMSGMDVTKQFEQEFSDWIGLKYSLAHSTGTAALQCAMWGCKVGVGDEIICPSVTYWASALQVFSLGGTVVFADIEPDTLCIDPDDIEHRITDRTKAIMVVHYLGYPADMDRIMPIARKHGLKVIEDVSHAHGGLYKGRMVGTFGDVAAMSLMSGKSLPIGEAGILCTNDLEIYERAIAFGHYERYNAEIQTPDLKPYYGLPLGGYKYRIHQMSSAVGRVQLKHYDARHKEIDKAMNHFWDLLEGVPGLRGQRPPKGSGSTKGGWYAPHGILVSEELGGLSITRFTEAVRAEGCPTGAGANKPLHLHPVFTECDIYGHGKPTIIANSNRDLRQYKGDLPVSEATGERVYSIPWFKHFRPEVIEQYANAFRKACESYEELLPGDPGNPDNIGAWHFFAHSG